MMMSKQRADWERFALLTASVKNILVSNEKDLTKADDLNPYKRKKNKPSAEKAKPLKVDKKFMINVFEKNSKIRKTDN